MKIFVTILVTVLVYTGGGIAMESYGITMPAIYAFFGFVIGSSEMCIINRITSDY